MALAFFSLRYNSDFLVFTFTPSTLKSYVKNVHFFGPNKTPANLSAVKVILITGKCPFSPCFGSENIHRSSMYDIIRSAKFFVCTKRPCSCSFKVFQHSSKADCENIFCMNITNCLGASLYPIVNLQYSSILSPK